MVHEPTHDMGLGPLRLICSCLFYCLLIMWAALFCWKKGSYVIEKFISEPLSLVITGVKALSLD